MTKTPESPALSGKDHPHFNLLAAVTVDDADIIGAERLRTIDHVLEYRPPG